MKYLRQGRAVLPLVLFAVIGWALHRCRGQYDGRALWAIVGAFLAAQLGFQAKPGLLLHKRAPLGFVLLLIYFLCLMLKTPLVIYADVLDDQQNTLICLGVALVLSVALAVRLGSTGFTNRFRFDIAWLAVPAAFALLWAKIFAMWSSPHPFMDVFTVPTQATDYFLAGQNPYNHAYTDIYHGFYDYPPAFDYWPGVLYIESFFRWLMGDIRWSSLLSDFGTAICIHRILVKLKHRELSWVVPLLWLAFPCSLFVLEQAWIDPILLFFGALFALFAVDRRWLRAGLALGAFCAVKQYAIFFALFALLLALRDAAPERAARRLIGGTLGSFIAILLPFILWDPSSFFERTVLLILREGVRNDALTLTAWFHYLHLPQLSGGMSAALYLLVTALGCFAVLRAKGNLLQAFFFSVTLTYGTVFIFGKQAFCNYYYLLGGFVLLQLVAGLGYKNAER